jgi:hypothetical protein
LKLLWFASCHYLYITYYCNVPKSGNGFKYWVVVLQLTFLEQFSWYICECFFTMEKIDKFLFICILQVYLNNFKTRILKVYSWGLRIEETPGNAFCKILSGLWVQYGLISYKETGASNKFWSCLLKYHGVQTFVKRLIIVIDYSCKQAFFKWIDLRTCLNVYRCSHGNIFTIFIFLLLPYIFSCLDI